VETGLLIGVLILGACVVGGPFCGLRSARLSGGEKGGEVRIGGPSRPAAIPRLSNVAGEGPPLWQMDDLSDALTAVELAARDGGRVVNTLGEILARLVAHLSRERPS
jgi:hypothetical protein